VDTGDGIPVAPFELFVRCFGRGEALAQDLLARVQAWSSAGRPSEERMRIMAYPRHVPCVRPTPLEDERVIQKLWTQMIVHWVRS
jgi:hypothetical protein